MNQTGAQDIFTRSFDLPDGNESEVKHSADDLATARAEGYAEGKAAARDTDERRQAELISTLVERASALVRRPPAPERRGWLAGLFGPGLLQPAGMAAAVAVAVAGLAGFQLGKLGAAEVVRVERIVAQEASLGLRGDDLF